MTVVLLQRGCVLHTYYMRPTYLLHIYYMHPTYLLYIYYTRTIPQRHQVPRSVSRLGDAAGTEAHNGNQA